MASGSFVVVIDKLPEIIEQLHGGVAKAVADTADEITMVYGATAPKRTGFMASSAYTVTKTTTSYGANIVGDGPQLPEVAKPEDDLTALAAVGAEYAGYVEFGTRNMGAQPAFIPAIDKVKPRFEARLVGLESKLKGIAE